MDEAPELLVPDAVAWRAWLQSHHAQVVGVWLVLAKKGTTSPTRLNYEEALQEALCYGWIDGQVRRLDAATYRQRFTPRRRRSPWSQSNVGRVERLIEAGRMQPAGLAEVRRAQDDGRWQAAYAGAATITVPADLTAALAAAPRAEALFEILTSQSRYALLYRLGAVQPSSRARTIARFVAALARGETAYPQKRTLEEDPPRRPDA